MSIHIIIFMNYKRNPNKTSIVPAILSGVTSVGLLYTARITPMRYGERYSSDMEKVGRDMRRAEENYRLGSQKEGIASSTI